MTRSQKLAILALSLGAAATACDDDPSPAMVTAPQARSQGVKAAATAVPAAPTAPVPAAPAAPIKARPVLCAQQLGKPGKDAPEASVGRAGDKGSLPEKLPVGGDGWTWINLWAAWCVPCKQEMPLLRAWEKQLAGERAPLRVAFVSLDDDPRQLDTFLTAEPASGTKATYWLEDGPRRAAWLKEAGFDGEPELPAHLLVDPSGKVRCRQQGAIEESDFVEVQKIVRGQRGGAGAGAGAGPGAKAKAGTERGDRKGKKP